MCKFLEKEKSNKFVYSKLKRLKIRDSKSNKDSLFSKFTTYNNYLLSQEWYLIKDLHYSQFINNRCFVCNSKSNLDVHHKDYSNLGSIKEINDLFTLCRTCHEQVHIYAEKFTLKTSLLLYYNKYNDLVTLKNKNPIKKSINNTLLQDLALAREKEEHKEKIDLLRKKGIKNINGVPLHKVKHSLINQMFKSFI